MGRRLRTGAALLILFLFVHSSLGVANSPGSYKPDEAYESINVKSLKAHVSFLASNLLEGREAASRGYDIAADYSASLFQQYGLTPIVESGAAKSFLQTYALLETSSKNTETLEVETIQGESRTTKRFANRVDFLIGHNNRTMSISAPVVFAGYGLVEKEANYDDFAGVIVKNKIVLVMTHAPGEGDEQSYFYKKENRNRFFNGTEIFEKQRNAQQRGALAVLMVNDPLSNHPTVFTNFASNIVKKPRNNINLSTPRRRMTLPGMDDEDGPIPIINISEEVGTAILSGNGRTLEALQLKINEKKQPASFELAEKRVSISAEVETKLVNTSNVIGLLEGSDPVLKNEYVVIGAHLDHEGARDGYIWNGADDDASGSAAVLELAAAFARSKTRPKRSMLFCLWGAEEKGLLGSRYFTMRPPAPLGKISAMLQLDMIGRDVEPRPYQLKGKPKPKDLKRYIFAEISKQSPEVGEIFMKANQTVGLEVNFGARAKLVADTDHYWFSVNKVPVLSIDDGVFHEDYHQPSDTADKINFDKIMLVSRVAYLTAREIANNPTKLRWSDDVPPDAEE